MQFHVPVVNLFCFTKCVAFACLVFFKLFQYQSVYALLDIGVCYMIYRVEVSDLSRTRLVQYILWLAYTVCMIACSSRDLHQLGGVHSWQDFPCRHAGSANNSNLKVIVAALPKMGTTTMYHALSDLGLHTYHDYDIELHYPLLFARPQHLNLAEYVSKCKADAICLDNGFQRAVDIIEVSPDAKLFIMKWRTPEQWEKSLTDYLMYLRIDTALAFMQMSGMFVPPWTTVFKLVNGIVTSDIIHLLRNGYPSVMRTWLPPSIYLELRLRMIKFLIQPGRSFSISKDFFNNWYRQVKSAGHRHVQIEIDPTLITYEDLCLHLQIKNCPRHGKLERSIDTFRYHRSFPLQAAFTESVFSFGSYMSFIIFVYLFQWSSLQVLGICRCMTRPKIN